MSHDFHQGPEDAVLFDYCAECDERADDPIKALLSLDSGNFERLLARMRAVELGDGREAYRTRNEARVGSGLYHIHVLLERHGRNGLA